MALVHVHPARFYTEADIYVGSAIQGMRCPDASLVANLFHLLASTYLKYLPGYEHMKYVEGRDSSCFPLIYLLGVQGMEYITDGYRLT